MGLANRSPRSVYIEEKIGDYGIESIIVLDKKPGLIHELGQLE
jgi:hypothetical protein